MPARGDISCGCRGPSRLRVVLATSSEVSYGVLRTPLFVLSFKPARFLETASSSMYGASLYEPLTPHRVARSASAENSSSELSAKSSCDAAGLR